MKIKNGRRPVRQVIIYLSVALATVLMFLHHYTSSTVFALIGLIFMLIPVLLCDTSEAIHLLLFYVPNIRMYKLNTGNTFVGLFIMALFFKVFFLNRTYFNINAVLAVLGMVFALSINMLVSKNTALLFPFVRFAMGLIIISTYAKKIIQESNYKQEYKNCLKYFIYGVVSMLICGLVYYIAKGNPLFEGRFRGINNDPNYFSMTIAVGISLMLTHIAFDKDSGVKDFAIVLFLLFGGMLTVSRSFIISISVNIVLILYIFMNVKSLSLKKKSAIILLIVLLCFVFKDTINTMIDSFVDRFNAESMEGGNGRVEISASYISLWKESILSMLFGVGKASHLYQTGVVSHIHHNYYVELLTSVGIFGVLAMLEIYRTLFCCIIPSKFRFRFILIFPIITYATMLLTLAALFDDTHLCILTLIFLQYKAFQDAGYKTHSNN